MILKPFIKINYLAQRYYLLKDGIEPDLEQARKNFSNLKKPDQKLVRQAFHELVSEQNELFENV